MNPEQTKGIKTSHGETIQQTISNLESRIEN
ncbi:MAG: hypothetical protein QG609_97, partial [Patescibacteria group bacterium]|nr:hypothetical protein [Patescibacteria group bacterium]